MAKQIAIVDLYNREIPVCEKWTDDIVCFNAFGRKPAILAADLIELDTLDNSDKFWILLHPDVIDEVDLKRLVEKLKKAYPIPDEYQCVFKKFEDSNVYSMLVEIICRKYTDAEKVIINMLKRYLNGYSDF